MPTAYREAVTYLINQKERKMATYDTVTDFDEFILMCREMGIDESRELQTDLQADIAAVEEVVRKELGNDRYFVCTNYSRGTIEVSKVKGLEELKSNHVEYVSSYKQALEILKRSSYKQRIFKVPEEVDPVEYVKLIKEIEGPFSEILLIDYDENSTPRTINVALLR